MSWLFYAFVSAAAAAVTAILAKIGIAGIPSTLATAVRTVVIMVFAWGLVFALGEVRALATVSRRSLVFLALSGIATDVMRRQPDGTWRYAIDNPGGVSRLRI